MSISVHVSASQVTTITTYYSDPAKQGNGVALVNVYSGDSNISLGGTPEQMLAFARHLHDRVIELAEQVGVVAMSTVASPQLAAELMWRDGR